MTTETDEKKTMTLEEVQVYLKTPLPDGHMPTAYADYFGPGWSMGWDGKFFVGINPHTGSLLGHGPFTERDNCDWYVGRQSMDKGYDD